MEQNPQFLYGFTIKQISVTRKADGWFIQLILEDLSVPEFTPDVITPTWDNSMVLSYRNEIIFTDCSIRDYWDEQNSLMVERDINAALNIKRLGLGIFPSIKRRSGNLSIVGTMDESTVKEILHTLHRAAKKPTSYL